MPRDVMPFDNAAPSIPPNDHAVECSTNAAARFFGRALGRIALFALIIAGIMLAAPHAAEAQSMTATITGTVTSGTDTTGVFGAAGADLTGDPFTLTFTFNGSGTQASQTCSGVLCSSYDEDSDTSNPGTATLSIGGGWDFGGGGPLPTSGNTSKAYVVLPNAASYVVTNYYDNSDVDVGSDGVGQHFDPIGYPAANHKL